MQIERDKLQSIILWGPPGVGKTTLARLIARLTHCEFVPFSAVLSGIKEIKAVMADAERMRNIDPERAEDPDHGRLTCRLRSGTSSPISGERRGSGADGDRPGDRGVAIVRADRLLRAADAPGGGR